MSLGFGFTVCVCWDVHFPGFVEWGCCRWFGYVGVWVTKVEKLKRRVGEDLEGTAVAVYAKTGVTADGGEVCTSY